jgi:hypothetical protein
MPRNILITEEQERFIINNLMKESSSFYPDSEKVMVVKDYIEKNFSKQVIDDIDANGYPTQSTVAIMKNKSGQPINSLKPRDLFLVLQDKFQTIYQNRNMRDAFLKQVAMDWLNGKITKEGILSTNSINL